MTGTRCSLRTGLSLMALTACGGGTQPIVPFATRDSAGVEIVESGSALWDSTPGWTVDSTPTLTIGKAEGDEPYLLSHVVDAFRRDDGSIVVLDGSSNQLRAFDSTGTFLVARGRRGNGPGEFRYIEYASRCGRDAIWVQSGQRISVWGTDLAYRREFTFADNMMWPLLCLDGTGLVVKEDVRRIGEDPSDVIYDTSLQLRVLDSLGGARRDLLTMRLRSYINISAPKGGIGFPHPFGSQTQLGQDGDQLVVGEPHELSFRRYSDDGRLRRIVRGPLESFELTSAMRNSYTSAKLIDRESIEIRTALATKDYPMPKGFPAYTALEVDRDGNTWVRRFEIPDIPARRWGVFRQDGRFLGHVTLPAGVQVLEIGSDYLLGLGKGPMDEEQVRMYRVRR